LGGDLDIDEQADPLAELAAPAVAAKVPSAEALGYGLLDC
jgi:hypothetical protein